MDIANTSMRTLCCWLGFICLGIVAAVGAIWTTRDIPTTPALDRHRGFIVLCAIGGFAFCVAMIAWIDWREKQPVFTRRERRGFDVKSKDRK